MNLNKKYPACGVQVGYFFYYFKQKTIPLRSYDFRGIMFKELIIFCQSALSI